MPLATYPLLDPTPLEDLWQAAPSRAERLLGIYIEDLTNHIHALTSALQQSRCTEISSIAHSLKSSSRQMGALRLGQAASRLEEAARTVPADPYLHQFVNSLHSLITPTVEAIHTQLETHKSNSIQQ